MKETRNFKLPVAGRVQHGEQIVNENGKKQVKEYGHFIAKIKETNMQHYLDEFNKLIKGSKSIDIQFLDDNPLTVRYERNNQGGRACYCMENEEIGKQKVKNLWQPIECTTECQYLQKDSNGKMACNRIAWLKFLIPNIATDRIWLMRITSQESINNLKGYIAMQKMQDKSLKGIYTIFLYQAEQVDGQGKIHNNYLVDIIEKCTNIKISVQQEKDNIDVQQDNSRTVQQSYTISNEKAKGKKKINTKKMVEDTSVNSQSKSTEQEKSKTINEDKADIKNSQNDEITGEYALISTSKEMIGEKEYTVGKFCDMNDEIHDIYIKPEFKDELQQCDLGTMVKLRIQEKSGKKFAMDLIYITKCIKKQVA